MIADVTTEAGQRRALVVDKQFNLKSDGTHWLPRISFARRGITYILTSKIDTKFLIR